MASADPRVRRQSILARVRSSGAASLTELAGDLGVAPETIRRDVRAMESQGVVKRSYGRVHAVEAGSFETDLERRSGQFLAEKRVIAETAAKQLAHVETCYIDEGYTPELIAESIPSDRMLTVVTSSLPLAASLAPRQNITVYATGGRVRGRTLGCVDRWAVDMVRQFVFDVAMIGANGISLDFGLTTPDPAVAAVKSAAITSARRVVFVGIHQKFGVCSFTRFGDVEQLDQIITDRLLPSAIARQYAAAGPEVIRV